MLVFTPTITMTYPPGVTLLSLIYIYIFLCHLSFSTVISSPVGLIHITVSFTVDITYHQSHNVSGTESDITDSKCIRQMPLHNEAITPRNAHVNKMTSKVNFQSA